MKCKTVREVISMTRLHEQVRALNSYVMEQENNAYCNYDPNRACVAAGFVNPDHVHDDLLLLINVLVEKYEPEKLTLNQNRNHNDSKRLEKSD